MKPIIKWAGGKSTLLETVKAMQPSNYNRYFEPFGGGAAILLGMKPGEATLNDLNAELVNMYLQVRKNPNAVINALRIWTQTMNLQRIPRPFTTRPDLPTTSIETAAPRSKQLDSFT